MLSERDVSAAIGSTAYSSSGDKLGTVEHFFADARTGAPSWVAVSSGLFGTRHAIVPAGDATFADGGLRLPVTTDAVKDAPHVAGDRLAPDDETRLRRHYGLETAEAAGSTGTGTGAVWTPTGGGLQPPGAASEDDVPSRPAVPPSPAEPPRPAPPRPASVPSATPVPPPPAAYRATAGTDETPYGDIERAAAKRVRLVKYLVTEEVQVTVPIRREEIRVEEVPLDAVDDGIGESLVAGEDSYGAHSDRRPASGDTSGGQPDAIVLHTERPVVTLEVVPTERVRLRTEVVRGQETVTGQVQREPIVVDETPSAGRVSPR